MAFEAFPETVPQFLTDLKANNSKEWFAQNKAFYDAGIKAPAQAFGSDLSAALKGATGLAHTSKLFRVYRDVRFSKDKTPYNAHLHMSFTPDASQMTPPMWFFGLGVETLSLGCGVFAFDKDGLEVYRHRVSGPDGDHLAALLQQLEDNGIRVSEPDLKRVPAGFDKDHPNGALLRRKGLHVWLDFTDRDLVTRPGLIPFCMAEFARLRPVFDFLIT